MRETTTCHHIVYWTIPQINAAGEVVGEQHFAVNLAEITPADARRIELLLEGGPDADPRTRRTDPGITEYRHLFRPFIEVKRRAGDLCRFSAVVLPFRYAECADQRAEPLHHTHPSVHPLAGTG